MNRDELWNEKRLEIDRLLHEMLPDPKEGQGDIIKVMEYNLLAGGKRIRPLFMQEMAWLFAQGKETDETQASMKALPYFMAAIEMIHTYSLIHDDLPAMDNDDYRRGRKTTHIVYGEAMGILAGDALLNYAFETAVKGILAEQEQKRAVQAFEVLARKAGIFGMIGGQVLDVKGIAQSPEKLEGMYRLKTGALLEAAMMIGAILGGASEKEALVAEQIAANIGIAFQIQDDILDLTGTDEELGKPAGSDEKNHKATYVAIRGLEASAQEVERLTAQAMELWEQLPGDNVFLREVLLALISRKC